MPHSPRAYSYLRFSTPEQMRGDSFRRQADASQHYAATHGLNLDTATTFQDLGVSAFRGKNAKEGALAQFTAAVEAGSIAPGSFLLVESLDRLSRQAVNRAFLQFQAIVDSGITVVTLQDGKVYTRESLNENFGDLMFSLAVMFRANEESTTKSKRSKAAWGAKRKRAVDGKHKLTSICPAWLSLDRPSGTFVVLKDRAAVVQRIFALALAGHGKATIAQLLNREGVPTFGRSNSWQQSYVQKVLGTEAVHGVFQPMLREHAGNRKRVADGEPVPDYFPAVVDRETFLQARRMRQGRKVEGGRKGARFSNLFTGIARCGHCGAPMHYVNKGSRTKVYLICSNVRRGAARCTNPAWRYLSVERFVLVGLMEVDYLELFPAVHKSAREKLDSLTRKRLGKEADLEKAKQQADNIVSLLAERPDSPAFKDKLVALEETSVALEGELTELTQQIDAEEERLRTVEKDFKQTQDALAALAKGMHGGDDAKVFDLRSRLHQLLKGTLAGITFTPSKRGPTHGDIEIAFVGTDVYRRVLRVEVGQNRAESFKIVGGKRESDGRHIELVRKPKSRVAR